MTKQFENIVNAPHRAFGAARKKVQELTPTSNAGRVARGVGITTAGLLQFLFWVSKYVALDNHATRALERRLGKISVGKDKDGNDKKFSAFVRRHPNLSGHALYYTMMAMLVYGGGAFGDNENDADRDASPARTETHVTPPPASVEPVYMTADDVKKMLDTHWYEIAVGLTELETYRATPKLHRGESRYTNGLGVTWTYTRNKNGKLVQSPNTSKTRANSRDANYEQVRMHLTYETLPKLARIVADTNLDERMSVALIYAGYQRLSDMSGIAHRIAAAQNPQQVADAFSYFYKVPAEYKLGSLKRRWVCAAYAVGAITADDLRKMSRDAFSDVDVNNIYRNGHFLLGAETVKYVLSRTNKNESVEAFLSEFSAGQKILAGGGHSVPMPVLNVALESSADVSIEKSMSLLNRGEAFVRQKKYADAVKVFQDAIAQDPDNMQAYSDLAFAYKKLGDVKHSVEYYEKATATVVQCNRRMNANKSLLFDYSVKASSYYNAGMAREEIAKIYTARGQKQLAADNYAKALKNYQNALYNCQQVDEDSRAIATYETAIARIQAMQSKSKKTTRPQVQKKKGKKVAFDAGAGRVSDSPMPGMTIAQMIELRNSRDMG